MKPVHWIAIALGALAGLWLFGQMAPTGGFNQPPEQPGPDDDLARMTYGNAPYCHPQQHHAGYVYTPHCYPRTAGGEITAVIHRGFSTMRVPRDTPDVQWIIAPPSEVIV